MVHAGARDEAGLWRRMVGTDAGVGVKWDLGVGEDTPSESAGSVVQGQDGSNSLQPTL